MRILLSRTDSIGDVILTLPMAGFIKKHLPDSEIHFLGRSYTKAVVSCCTNIDSFVNFDDFKKPEDAIDFLSKANYDACIHVFPKKEIAEVVKKAMVPIRIGTSGRLYHWFTCNKIIRFSRKRSELHESQLNLKLLKGLNLPTVATFKEIISFMDFKNIPKPSEKVQGLIHKEKINLILHPKSKGSAIEWGLDNFNALIKLLPKEKYQVFISGTNEDKKAIGDSINYESPHVTSLLGELSLDEFISFISLSDGLVAASTGPLHIAAALGKLAIGLYSPRRPIHPGRWMPIGKAAKAMVFDEKCEKCTNKKPCDCIKDINPETIANEINQTFSGRF